MSLRLRAAAVRDMEGILDYGIAMHGVAAAEAYARSLDATMQRLLDFPELGVARGDLRPGLRSLPSGEHRISIESSDRRSSSPECFTRRWMRHDIFEACRLFVSNDCVG